MNSVRPKWLDKERTIPRQLGLGLFMDSVVCMYQFFQWVQLLVKSALVPTVCRSLEITSLNVMLSLPHLFLSQSIIILLHLWTK